MSRQTFTFNFSLLIMIGMVAIGMVAAATILYMPASNPPPEAVVGATWTAPAAKAITAQAPATATAAQAPAATTLAARAPAGAAQATPVSVSANPAAASAGTALRPRAGQTLVLGYYPVDWAGDTTAYNAVRSYGKHIDAVTYFGYTVDWSGNVNNPYPNDEQRLLNLARQNGQQVVAVVHNYMNGGFDRNLLHYLLTNRQARQRVIENIFKIMQKGYAGVNIDLENADPNDRAAYTAFIRDLAARLRPAGYSVTLAIPAKTADVRWDGWSGGYDYAALGQLADQIVIMSYDEHWIGGPAGPVASIGWAEKVARYTANTIPKNKVLFGIPTYGYDWVLSGSGSPRALSAVDAAARAQRFGAKVQWDAQAQVPFYEYWTAGGARRIVYYENASSMAAKVDLVTRYGFGGIALWRLGFEDPAAWEGVIHGKLHWR